MKGKIRHLLRFFKSLGKTLKSIHTVLFFGVLGSAGGAASAAGKPVNPVSSPVSESAVNATGRQPSAESKIQLAGIQSSNGLGAGIKVSIPPPLVGVDLNKEADDVWEFIRRGFAIPDLYMKNIGANERDLLRSTEHLRDMLQNSEPYIHYIASECERRGLPTELALVPFIESRFNPHARSHANAEGLWQIIPSTGRHFELKQNQWVDERRDLMASTRAALDYFAYLYDLFGDWHLALLAYNWGEGSLQKAINSTKARGMQPNIGNLDLPEETRRYIPKLQAIKNVIQNPEHYGIALPHLPNEPYFVEVRRKSNISITEIAKRSGVGLDALKALNPGLKQDIWHVAHSESLLIPVQFESQVKNSFRAAGTSAGTAGGVSRAVVNSNTKPAVMRTALSGARDGVQGADQNQGRMGSKVPSPAKASSSKPRQFKSYEVKPGEGLSELARRFDLDAQELAALNGLSRKPLKAGMLISVPR